MVHIFKKIWYFFVWKHVRFLYFSLIAPTKWCKMQMGIKHQVWQSFSKAYISQLESFILKALYYCIYVCVWILTWCFLFICFFRIDWVGQGLRRNWCEGSVPIGDGGSPVSPRQSRRPAGQCDLDLPRGGTPDGHQNRAQRRPTIWTHWS